MLHVLNSFDELSAVIIASLPCLGDCCVLSTNMAFYVDKILSIMNTDDVSVISRDF